jgi:Tol biopolymer transport system component
MFLQRCRLAMPLTCALLLALPAGAHAAYPGTNGKLAFANDSTGTFDIYSVSPLGSPLPPTPLTHSPALESEPAWSPDGSQIAFSFVSGGFGNVFVMNADGTGARNVTNQVDSFNTKPTWSPDGSKIAFYSDRNDGDNEIYVVNADGSGPQKNLTNAPTTGDFGPAWSPDGSKIAFTRVSGNAADIFVMNAADGSSQVNRTTFDSAGHDQPTWSPDGSKIAFRHSVDFDSEIYVINADGSGTPRDLTHSPEPDQSPSWSPDGSKIAFASFRSGGEEIWLMDADGANPTQFTANLSRDNYPDWQPRAANSASITVRNAERPSTAGGTFDLKVNNTVVRAAAGHGDSGTDSVSPGVYLVGEAASGGTSLDDFASSYACTRNGHADVSGPGSFIDVAVAFGDTEVCTVTNTLGARTPAGSNIAATPVDVSTGDFPVSILFGFVGSAGVTTLESSATGPSPPAGFDVDGSYYHLESTAEFAAAEVCFPYTGTPPSIVHWVAGTPEILLTTRITSTAVCAEVDSFSPFALARPTGDDTDAPDVTCGSADGAWHGDNVAIGCTATDAGSGVAEADAAFALTTSVAAGTEDASAQTGSRQVCDLAGNCAPAGPIGGNKIDRKAPKLALPAGKTVDATSAAGAVVSYTVTAADGADPHPVVHCAPASGATFKIGSNTVACTATDHVGNTDRGSFTVTVRDAKEQIDRLISEVVAASKLPPAVKTQLLAQMRAALARFDPGKPVQRKAMCDALGTFAAAVRLLSGHGITPAQATQWIADANRIRAVIGCGTR